MHHTGSIGRGPERRTRKAEAGSTYHGARPVALLGEGECGDREAGGACPTESNYAVIEASHAL